MVIKWKRNEGKNTVHLQKHWRNNRFVGWLSFFLGTSILLTVVGCSLGPQAAASLGSSSYQDLLQDNYKNTNLFRNSIVSSIYAMAYVHANGSYFGSLYSPYNFHSCTSAEQEKNVFPCAAVENDKLIYQRGGMNYHALCADGFHTKMPLLKITLQSHAITGVEVLQNGNTVDPDNNIEWVSQLRNTLLHRTIPNMTDDNGKEPASGITSDKGRTLYFTLTDSLPNTSVYNAYAAEKQLYNGIINNLGFLIPAILLAIAILFYPGKQSGDRTFASFAGHIPVEIKLVLLLFLYISPFAFGMIMLSSLSSFALSHCLFLLLWYVWLTYFLINDIRYKTFAMHSLIRHLWRSMHNALYKNAEKAPLTHLIQRWLLPLYIFVNICMIPCVMIFSFSDSLFYSPSGYHHLLRFCFFGGLAALTIYLEYRCWKKADFLGSQMAKLTNQIRLIRSGVQPPPFHVGGCDQLSAAAYDLNAVQDGIEAAVNERVRSERMKVELVTNVSHDLKTPLTSIISYVHLLQEEELSPTAYDYVQILAQKSDRLKSIVQDVFDISKAVSGNLTVNCTTLDLAKLLRQTLADMDEQITAAPVTFRTQLPEKPVWIFSDGDRLYRVFQNLFQNAAQYSLESSRVFVTLEVDPAHACVRVRNTSKYEIGDAQALLERFTRGDNTRSSEGSGLGLSIAQSFTAACGGTFSISAQADLFTAEVNLPLSKPPQPNQSSEIDPHT